MISFRQRLGTKSLRLLPVCCFVRWRARCWWRASESWATDISLNPVMYCSPSSGEPGAEYSSINYNSQVSSGSIRDNSWGESSRVRVYRETTASCSGSWKRRKLRGSTCGRGREKQASDWIEGFEIKRWVKKKKTWAINFIELFQ